MNLIEVYDQVSFILARPDLVVNIGRALNFAIMECHCLAHFNKDLKVASISSTQLEALESNRPQNYIIPTSNVGGIMSGYRKTKRIVAVATDYSENDNFVQRNGEEILNEYYMKAANSYYLLGNFLHVRMQSLPERSLNIEYYNLPSMDFAGKPTTPAAWRYAGNISSWIVTEFPQIVIAKTVWDVAKVIGMSDVAKDAANDYARLADFLLINNEQE